MSKSSKLTLSVPSQVVRRAKHYARIHNTSISSIVTKLFESLGQSEELRKQVSAAVLTESSVGMIALEADLKKSELISNAISEKYQKR